MEATLQVLNELERKGVLGRYAIGWAVAAIFYMEPFATFDLDIFVILPTQGMLITLEPLYAALNGMGYSLDKECVVIEGVPVQFLPAYNPLVEEALSAAQDTKLGETITRVLLPEYLAAIMVQTGRSKDRQRLTAFLEQAVFDKTRLESILAKHQLDQRFSSWTHPLNS
ncbi:hypothetical protein GCM10023213_24070 [Prosthecobacter algae]|uniref:Nucleotidyltransferase family protein n=1 Tax=Prosthecobacter algae TaxID=1144682 RepID=A0ABP9P864_9BACT